MAVGNYYCINRAKNTKRCVGGWVLGVGRGGLLRERGEDEFLGCKRFYPPPPPGFGDICASASFPRDVSPFALPYVAL
jgi:hypothetical protein